MKPTTSFFRPSGLLASLLLWMGGPESQAQSDLVHIPDPELQSVIRDTLNKPTGDLTVADTESLMALDASLQTRGAARPASTSLEGIGTARDLDVRRDDPTFTDANWSTLGSETALNGQVNALALMDGDLYAGGTFTSVGGGTGNYVARWNGSSWAALGSGIDGPVPGQPVFFPFGVRALAVLDGQLYAGGIFDTVGGITAQGLARWNGSSWSGVGGFVGFVYALAVSGSDLYVGGAFSHAGDITANCIAKWDGTNWSALGSGMDGGHPRVGTRVQGLAVLGNDLYAHGEFTVPAYYIARWDGRHWSGISGLGDVYALAASGDYLYAVKPSGHVVRWQGESSRPEFVPGLIQGGAANVLAALGNDLYVGGDFTHAGGAAASGIAKWDGNSWTALSSGMNGAVRALVVSGSDLYVGGGFTMAGGKVAGYVARAYLPALPRLSIRPTATEVTVSWPSADTAEFTLEQSQTLDGPAASWSALTASVADDGTNKWVTLPATNTPRFFRLRRP